MKNILGFLFDRLTDPLGLPISALWEYLILFLLAAISYHLAFSAVGRLYRDHYISTCAGGSVLHWGIRLIVFFAFWATLYGLISLGKILLTNWVLALGVPGGLIAIGATISWFVRRRKEY